MRLSSRIRYMIGFAEDQLATWKPRLPVLNGKIVQNNSNGTVAVREKNKYGKRPKLDGLLSFVDTRFGTGEIHSLPDSFCFKPKQNKHELIRIPIHSTRDDDKFLGFLTLTPRWIKENS
jgi:hypothetical protein